MAIGFVTVGHRNLYFCHKCGKGFSIKHKVSVFATVVVRGFGKVEHRFFLLLISVAKVSPSDTK